MIELSLGILFGLLTPVFAMALLIEAYPQLPKMTEIPWSTWEFLIIRIMTFAIIINAVVFFMALRMSREPLARGVLFACIASAIFLVIIKFVL